MYAVTGDEVLGDALRKGDVYTEDAKAILGLPEHLVKCSCKDEGHKTCVNPTGHLKTDARKSAKESHLAWQYGASLGTGMATIWKRDYTIPVEIIIQAWETLPVRYWRTVEWQKEEWVRVVGDPKRGIRGCYYSESRILGRRQVYPSRPTPSDVYNFPNQATLADHVNLWIIGLDAELEKLFGKWVVVRSVKRSRQVPTTLDLHRHLVGYGQHHPDLIASYLADLTKMGASEAGLVTQLHDAVDVDHPEELTDEVVEILKRTGEVPRTIEGKEHVFPLEIKTAEIWSDV